MSAAVDVAATIDDLAATIAAHRYTYARETELHLGIEQALHRADYHPVPEVRLSPRDRIDFLVDGIGVEVKVKGTADALMAQCMRYVEHDDVLGLLVVTTRARHRSMPASLNGKPVRTLLIGGIG